LLALAVLAIAARAACAPLTERRAWRQQRAA